MSLEDVYVNIDDLKIEISKSDGREETGSCPDRAEAVACSETAHVRVALVCLAVLSLTLLLTVIGVGVQYSTAYHELMGDLKNRTLEMEQLQSQNQNLTLDRDRINSSYHSVLTELHQAQQNMESCPDGWRRFRCKCYYLSPTSTTWGDSRRQCQNMGADLVSIKSKDEMMFLNKYGATFWIGLSRPQGNWQWTDGSSFTSSYWAPGHPQYFNSQNSWHNKNCAAFNTFSLGIFTNQIKSWTSESCRYTNKQWVCEKEATPPSVS